MGKTPYEVRLEILKMAKEMLEADYISTKDRLQQDWQVEVNRSNETNAPLPKHPILPSFPTPADIIQKAQILNTFVSNG